MNRDRGWGKEKREWQCNKLEWPWKFLCSSGIIREIEAMLNTRSVMVLVLGRDPTVAGKSMTDLKKHAKSQQSQTCFLLLWISKHVDASVKHEITLKVPFCSYATPGDQVIKLGSTLFQQQQKNITFSPCTVIFAFCVEYILYFDLQIKRMWGGPLQILWLWSFLLN